MWIYMFVKLSIDSFGLNAFMQIGLKYGALIDWELEDILYLLLIRNWRNSLFLTSNLGIYLVYFICDILFSELNPNNNEKILRKKQRNHS